MDLGAEILGKKAWEMAVMRAEFRRWRAAAPQRGAEVASCTVDVVAEFISFLLLRMCRADSGRMASAQWWHHGPTAVMASGCPGGVVPHNRDNGCCRFPGRHAATRWLSVSESPWWEVVGVPGVRGSVSGASVSRDLPTSRNGGCAGSGPARHVGGNGG